MGAQDILEEDAREDWISRGFPIQEFSVKKMTEIWDEEEQEEINKEKRAKLLEKKHKPLKGEVKSIITIVQKEIQHAAVNVKESIRQFEPTILRDRRWLREHIALVHRMDDETMKYKQLKLQSHTNYMAKAKIENEKNAERHERIQHKAPLLRRLREMKDEAERHDRAVATEEIEHKWEEWREKESEMKQEYKIQAQKQNDEHIAYKRRMNKEYWKQKLFQSRKEADEAKRHFEETREMEKQHKMDEFQADMNNVDQSVIDNENYGLDRQQSLPSLGVFEVPLERGAFYSLEDGGYNPELDRHTIAIPTAGPFDMENEVKRIELMEIQSKLLGFNENLEKFEMNTLNAINDQKIINEKKNNLINGINQIEYDHQNILKILSGPPRRDPSTEDRAYIHSLLKLKSTLSIQLNELINQNHLINEQIKKWKLNENLIHFQIKELNKNLQEKENQMNDIDTKMNALPMIVGRSIGHTNQNEQPIEITPNLPKETLDIITQRTKLELIKAATAPAFQLYEEARSLGLETWKMSKQKIIDESEVEMTLQRLAKIKDSLTKQQTLNQRTDVVNAIEKFHNKKEDLYRVKKISNGKIDWWKHRDIMNSLSVLEYNSNGITIDSKNRKGIIRGSFLLPNHFLWKIKFQIDLLNRELIDLNSFTTEDYIKINFGSTSGTVKQIGVYHVLDETGKILPQHNIIYEYVGTRLYFSFEFLTSYESIQKNQKQIIFFGTFEEDSNENQTIMYSGTHVLSEYVKMIRVQSQQGNHRCAVLLEELIRVEESELEIWDSKVLHGHSQRFQRTTYAKQLRQAIQEEIAKTIQYDINKRRQSYNDGFNRIAHESINDGVIKLNEKEIIYPKEKRLENSTLNYRHRKSEYIETTTKRGRDFVGLSLEIVRNKSWFKGMIFGMRIEWKEGGTKLNISHLTKFKENSKTEWIHLFNEKYVLLANELTQYIIFERQKIIEINVLDEIKKSTKNQPIKKTYFEIEQEYIPINEKEDELFQNNQFNDIKRRENLLQFNARRICTYDPQVKSLLELETRRLMQNIDNQDLTYELILAKLKNNYVQHYIETRIEFIKRTWERKNKKRLEKRKKERDERKQKYTKSTIKVIKNVQNELLENKKIKNNENLKLQLKKQLIIPSFQLAIAPEPNCIHLKLKHWGNKYKKGIQCKKCGKEMTQDNMDDIRGADPNLDRDIERHRLDEPSFPFENPQHLLRIENERLRLEKEAREIQLQEILSYDSTHMKTMEAFNFRHYIDRNYENRNDTRNERDRHEAAYRDEMSFFSRVNQYRYRLKKIFQLRENAFKERLFEIEIIENLQIQKAETENFLLIIQNEQERARELIQRRNEAIERYKISAKNLQNCLIEKTLAFRAREGVEEEAKIAMLHATALERTSLKMRRIWDVAHSERQKVKEELKNHKIALEEAKKHRQSLSDQMLALNYRKKGTKVYSMYGIGYVHYYREIDGVLVVKLAKWKATVYIPLIIFIQYDKAREQRELLAMQFNEIETINFIKNEKKNEKNEIKNMENEEKICREIVIWSKSIALRENEIEIEIKKKEIQIQIEMILKLNKIKYQKEAENDAIRAHTVKFQHKRQKIIKKSEQINKKQSKIEKKKIARASLKRLMMSRVENEIVQVQTNLIEKYNRIQLESIVNEIGQNCFMELLNELLFQITHEALDEGKHTANMLELQTTVVYSRQYPHVQGHIHAALERQGKGHLYQLQVIKRTWLRQLERLRYVQAEVKRRKEIEIAAEIERKRIEELCKEMAREEMISRRFYREEKRMILKETRCMQIAETEMREYLRLYELQLMMEKYNALGGDDLKESSLEARRIQIKKGKREKQRLAEEWASIKEEDRLAMAIREIYLKELHEKEYEEQQLEFMLEQAAYQESDPEDELEIGENYDTEEEGEELILNEEKKRIEKLNPKLREKAIEQFEKKIKIKEISKKKRKEFLFQLNEEYIIKIAETMYSIANADIKIIEISKELEYFKKLDFNSEQVKEMQIDLKRNQNQSKKIMEGAREKNIYAQKCIIRSKEAEIALEKAIIREKKDEKYMQKIIKETKYMDSAVLHQRCQRFLTDYIAGELYKKYFQTLVEFILLRTYLVHGERRILQLAETIETFDKESKEKSIQVTRLWRQHTRAYRMRLCRSELGKMIFRRHRKMALRMAFQGWLKVWHHSSVVRNAYELRYNLIRQEQRVHALETMHTNGSHLKAGKEASPSATRLAKFQHRWVHCRLCKTRYSEAQNHQFACSYHPGRYERACIKSCPSRKGEPVGTNCMLHRAMRWLCCDETVEGAFGSTGCKKRFHVAVRNDPQTEATVELAEEQERSRMENLNQELNQIENKGVSRTVFRQLRDQLQDIQQDLASQREKAARYDEYHKY